MKEPGGALVRSLAGRMRSFHRLELVRREWRSEGAAAAARKGWNLASEVILGQHRLLFAMTGDKAAGIEVSPPEGLAVRRYGSWDELGPQERAFVNDNARLIHWDVPRSLAAGAVTWIAAKDGTPVSIAQTRRGDRIEVYFFPMTETCVLVSHCMTLPDWRGRGYYEVMLRHVSRELQREGCRRIYIDCLRENKSSQRGIIKAGFLEIGRGIHRRNGSIVWWQETPPSVSRLEC